MSIISPAPARIDRAFIARSARFSLGLDRRVRSDVAEALTRAIPSIPEANRVAIATAIRAELTATVDRAGNAGDWRAAADALDRA